ncbi:transposase [Mesorhizobium sp. M0029]|uniref:transposase n=1 Tax=Mesorhizobium sp. M0029 TaxID=2956850 RepID=UPI003335C529
MARHRSYSITFKRQVVQEYLSGDTFHSLAQRHDITRTLIRILVGKYEAGGLDEDVASAALITDTRRGLPRLSDLSASRLWNWSF